MAVHDLTKHLPQSAATTKCRAQDCQGRSRREHCGAGCRNIQRSLCSLCEQSRARAGTRSEPATFRRVSRDHYAPRVRRAVLPGNRECFGLSGWHSDVAPRKSAIQTPITSFRQFPHSRWTSEGSRRTSRCEERASDILLYLDNALTGQKL